MNGSIRIKDLKVPHKTYETRSGLLYAIPVDVSMPDDLIVALTDVNEGYLKRFGECSAFSIHAKEDRQEVSYLISLPRHRISLRINEDSGQLYVPSNLPAESLYLLNELLRTFSVKASSRSSMEIESSYPGLSERTSADVREAVRIANVKRDSGLFPGVIGFMEEAVSKGDPIELSPKVIEAIEDAVDNF